MKIFTTTQLCYHVGETHAVMWIQRRWMKGHRNMTPWLGGRTGHGSRAPDLEWNTRSVATTCGRGVALGYDGTPRTGGDTCERWDITQEAIRNKSWCYCDYCRNVQANNKGVYVMIMLNNNNWAKHAFTVFFVVFACVF